MLNSSRAQDTADLNHIWLCSRLQLTVSGIPPRVSTNIVLEVQRLSESIFVNIMADKWRAGSNGDIKLPYSGLVQTTNFSATGWAQPQPRPGVGPAQAAV